MAEGKAGKLIMGGWNKGISPSEETRHRMSESHKGKKHTEEEIRKITEGNVRYQTQKNNYPKEYEYRPDPPTKKISGQRNFRRKLSFEEVGEIKTKLQENVKQSELAWQYRVSRGTIQGIKNGMNYKEVK